MVSVIVYHGQEVVVSGFEELMDLLRKCMEDGVIINEDGEVCGKLGELWVCTDFKTYAEISINETWTLRIESKDC